MRVRRGTLIRTAFAAVCLSLITATPVAAETPTAVLDEIADDGVYVGSTFDIDEEVLAASVSKAKLEGLTIVAIAPNDPEPDAEAFGLRVLQASGTSGLDAVVVFTEDGEHQVVVSEDYDDQVVRALHAVRASPTPAAAVDALAEALVAENQPSVPAAIDVVKNWVFLLLALLVIAVILDVLWRQRLRRQLKERRAARYGDEGPLSSQLVEPETAQSNT